MGQLYPRSEYSGRYSSMQKRDTIHHLANLDHNKEEAQVQINLIDLISSLIKKKIFYPFVECKTVSLVSFYALGIIVYMYSW